MMENPLLLLCVELAETALTENAAIAKVEGVDINAHGTKNLAPVC